MDEGPVVRRHTGGWRPRVRAVAARLSPHRYHAAYAVHLLRRFNAGYAPPSDPRYTMVIVNHYFDQDIAWLRRAASDVAIYELPYVVFSDAASSVLPPQAERFPAYYAPELAPGRHRYSEYVSRIFTALRNEIPLDVVVATSDLFWWDREFEPTLRDLGIPFFVIEKEGLMTPYFYEQYSREFREHAPPIADHHLVWSARQAYFWELAGQASDRISIVGQPRSDFWSHPEEWQGRGDLGLPLRDGSPLVVFFSYESWFYLSWDMYLTGEFTWEPLRAATNAALIEIARRRPDVDVVVKLHPQQSESGLESYELPSNMHVVGGSTLGNALLLNADVLVLFQSTATVESMFRSCPIVYPFFGDSVDRHIESMLPFHANEIVTVARSPAEILAGIEAGINEGDVARDVVERRFEFLEEYLDRPDGTASRRTLERVGDLIGKQLRVEAANPLRAASGSRRG